MEVFEGLTCGINIWYNNMRAYSSRTFASLENWWGLKNGMKNILQKMFFFTLACRQINEVTLNM